MSTPAESVAAWHRRQLAIADALKSVRLPRRAIPLAELRRVQEAALKAIPGDADAWAREKRAERRAYEDHVCSTTGQLCRCEGRQGAAKVEPDPAEDLRAGRRYLQARLDVERARLAIRANIYTSGA